jgi:L-iditol 2-dehydrogenase
MKALVLKNYNHFRYEDVPDPECAPHEVLVEIKACGICGSDVHGMDGSSGRRIPPIIMGHEASGVIEKTGSRVKNWKVGDRVTFDSTIYPLDDWYTRKGLYNLSDNRRVFGVSCQDYRRDGAFAELVVVPQHILYRIPDGVTFNQAALVEPIAVAMHAVDLTTITKGDSAVVVGVGIIGQFVVQLLRLAGCSTIIAVDIDINRLERAGKNGADHVLHAEKDDVQYEIYNFTEGRGCDVAMEVVGIASSVNTAIKSVRKGGSVTLIGNIAPRVEIPLQTLVTNQIRLQGSCAICSEYPGVLKLIEQGRIKVDEIISATAPLSEGPLWFKKLYNKESDLMKVILNP